MTCVQSIYMWDMAWGTAPTPIQSCLFFRTGEVQGEPINRSRVSIIFNDIFVSLPVLLLLLLLLPVDARVESQQSLISSRYKILQCTRLVHDVE